MTFTPANNFEQHVLVVTGHLADGTPTDTTTYLFYVADGQLHAAVAALLSTVESRLGRWTSLRPVSRRRRR